MSAATRSISAKMSVAWCCLLVGFAAIAVVRVHCQLPDTQGEHHNQPHPLLEKKMQTLKKKNKIPLFNFRVYKHRLRDRRGIYLQ